MRLSLVAAPQTEPLTVEEANDRLRITGHDSDSVMSGLVTAARHRAERITGRQFNTATWDQKLDAVPCESQLRLLKPPLLTVVSVSYVDTAGATQVWSSANYQVDAPTGPTAGFGRLQPAYATNWPAARTDTLNAFVVRFTAGYGPNGSDVPEDIRAAIALIVRHLYDDEALALERALALLTPYKVFA